MEILDQDDSGGGGMMNWGTGFGGGLDSVGKLAGTSGDEKSCCREVSYFIKI